MHTHILKKKALENTPCRQGTNERIHAPLTSQTKGRLSSSPSSLSGSPFVCEQTAWAVVLESFFATSTDPEWLFSAGSDEVFHTRLECCRWVSPTARGSNKGRSLETDYCVPRTDLARRALLTLVVPPRSLWGNNDRYLQGVQRENAQLPCGGTLANRHTPNERPLNTVSCPVCFGSTSYRVSFVLFV